MAVIKFKGIPENEIINLIEIFEFIANGKRNNNIDESNLALLLGERHRNRFWWPTREELEDWMRRWKEAAVENRHDDPNLKTPWAFGSWVDAFLNAEISFEAIDIDQNGEGKLKFEQLAHPSGGIEATEEIIKIFDGAIIYNDAI